MRVKRGPAHLKRRKNLLKHTKGFLWGRKNKIRQARTAVLKAGAHAYRGRKNKKRENRRIWNIKINAGAREHGLSYSKFMFGLKKSKIAINRKMLADLAENNSQAFEKIVKSVK